MKQNKSRISLATIIIAMIAIFSAIATIQFATRSSVQAEDKLTLKDVIAKHLEAIGPQETRESITTRLVSGACKFTVKNGQAGSLQGPAVIASDGKKILLGMNFGHTTYPFEKLGYDGQKLTVAYIAPTVRSSLGNFLITEDVSFREGLMGGVLSAAWPLFDANWNNSRIEYGGLKKVDGQQVHELRYSPRKGSESKIKLFFDATTFNHVRTEYLKVISAQMGATPELSSRQRETRYELTESFGDFKKASVLTLPHSYKVQLVVAGNGPSYSAEWAMNFDRVQFNQKIPAESFNVEKAATSEKK